MRYRPIPLSQMRVTMRFAFAMTLYWLALLSKHYKVKEDIWVSFGEYADPTDLACMALMDRRSGHWEFRFSDSADIARLTENIAHEFSHILDWDVSKKIKEDHADGQGIWLHDIDRYMKQHSKIECSILIEPSADNKSIVIIEGTH